MRKAKPDISEEKLRNKKKKNKEERGEEQKRNQSRDKTPALPSSHSP